VGVKVEIPEKSLKFLHFALLVLGGERNQSFLWENEIILEREVK
jgi:hypothetical protein